MSWSNPILVTGTTSGQSVYEVKTTPLHFPGTRAKLEDGREFEYVRSDNGTAIGKGKLATYDPIVAAHDKVTPVAAAIGATSLVVSVTLTLVANELAGGMVSVDKDTGLGEQYKIIGHAAHTSGNLTLLLARPVVVALTTSSLCTIDFGPCAVKISAAVVASAEAVEVAAGVPLVEIPIGSTTPQYAWVQKTGRAAVLFSAGVGSVGLGIYHGADAGSFQLSIDTTAQNAQVVLGTIMALLPITAEYHSVNLSIA